MNESENSSAKKRNPSISSIVIFIENKNINKMKKIEATRRSPCLRLGRRLGGIILIILITVLVSNVYSQDTNIVKYFPMKVGNVWVYSGSTYSLNCVLIMKRRIKVTGSVILNSKKYFVVQDSTKLISGNCGTPWGSVAFNNVRVDSINGNIYQYSDTGCSYSPGEIMVDSLRARTHDTIKIICGQDRAYICSDTSSQVIFGQTLPGKNHSEIDFEGGFSRIFVKGIGQSNYRCGGTWGSVGANLMGCVIDGILHGDTSFYTGIKPISNQIPENFSLYQNYPNPFNPSTKIKFILPLPSRRVESSTEGVVMEVTLKIYDIRGREIASLISPHGDGLIPGTYEVEWFTGNYPSGVYFYTIKTPDYVETKKMVLMK